MFESYEQDFSSAISNLKYDMVLYDRATEDPARKALIEKMKKVLTDCENKLKMMENEASFKGGATLMTKIRKHRNDYDEQKKKLMQIESVLLERIQKKELFNARGTNNGEVAIDPRTRVMITNEKAYQQNKDLTDVIKIGNEIDDRTNEVNRELFRQRGVIEQGITTNKDIGKELNRANYTANEISRNECVNKSLLWISIIILTGVNIYLLIHMLLQN